MRARVGAPAAVVARVRAAWVARVGAWLLASTWLLASGRARADVEEERAPDGPFVLRLAIDNDNLLFGSYARLAGRELDGTDLGRTHASSIGLGYATGGGVALRLDASSELFTRALDGRSPVRDAMVPIVFHELDRFRLGIALGQHDAPWRVRLGAAAEISNHEEVTIGASGQQRWWHDFMANTMRSGAWQFDHRPSGQGVTVGAAADAAGGGRATLVLAPWLRLRVAGEGGLRLASIIAGSALTARGRVALSIGEPRGVRLVLSAGQRAHLWLASPGVMVRGSLAARLDLRVLAVEIAFHRYDGDQNAGYYFYALANTTMTASLALRI
jgi:hypothetical protein